jgi:hypothetical protein
MRLCRCKSFTSRRFLRTQSIRVLVASTQEHSALNAAVLLAFVLLHRSLVCGSVVAIYFFTCLSSVAPPRVRARLHLRAHVQPRMFAPIYLPNTNTPSLYSPQGPSWYFKVDLSGRESGAAITTQTKQTQHELGQQEGADNFVARQAPAYAQYEQDDKIAGYDCIQTDHHERVRKRRHARHASFGVFQIKQQTGKGVDGVHRGVGACEQLAKGLLCEGNKIV